MKHLKYYSRVVCLITLSAVLNGSTPLLCRAQDLPQSPTAAQLIEASGVKGGLVVHLGCGDGKLTAALRVNERYIVHGLDTDAAAVDSARKAIRSQGIYGLVSVDRWNGARLPYVDNSVNVLISEKPPGALKDEVLRVLVPNGVALVRDGGKWSKTVKPRPKEMDEWTHYLYTAENNAVSNDALVGPPRHLQWVGNPWWSRHHDHMASMSALVSANGRIFYIMDEGSKASIQLPPKWFLIARDAFNGVILWKRPIPLWNTHKWPLKSGPSQLPRRLVAVGDRVYATPALDAPVTVFDAATGDVVKTYAGSEGTEEFVLSDGILYCQITDAPLKKNEYRQKFTYVWDNSGFANKQFAWDEKDRTIMAVEADSGRVLWTQRYPVAPLTLGVGREHVYFHDGEKVVALDRKNGELVWKSEPTERRTPIPTGFSPVLVVHDDVVLFAGGTRSMSAFSARDGRTLWTGKHLRGGHQSPEDLLVIGGLVWSGQIAVGTDSGIFQGVDLRTGEVKKEFAPDIDIYWFHHRCYRCKATNKYILASRTGIEFVDLAKEHWDTNHWVRGGCLYGVMPANGLVYAPPHSCGCYLESKLYGFNALAPEIAWRKELQEESDAARLERGPAYGQAIRNPQSTIRKEDWPTYRADAARSGTANTAVPTDLAQAWQAKLGGRLSSPVVAEGKVFVAAVDTHTVHAFDENSGKPLWNYTAGGRVDSPPTIFEGRVLFGSADGYVYCLRAADGQMIWRFRAAPHDLRLMAFEQLESVWPVHGSVLVQNGILYCLAGRSMFLDNGLRLLQLDPQTGRKITETILNDRDPSTGKNLQSLVNGLNMPVALPDILSSDGRYLYLRSQRFELDGRRPELAPRPVTAQVGDDVHLFATTGFLDDSWFHRSYWMFGRATAWGWGGWPMAAHYVPYGRILAVDEANVYGYGRKPEYLAQSSVLEYHIFAADKTIREESIKRAQRGDQEMNAQGKQKNSAVADFAMRKSFPPELRAGADFKWKLENPPLIARALVLAGKTLFLAGPPDVVDEEQAFFSPDDPAIQRKLAEQDEAMEGKKGALLWAVSASDGTKKAELALESPPVFDGMAAANGRLYMATMDGRVMCLAPRSGE
ncbi:MAG: PQQ-binding-like beta-propeller repeat protein [Candidatus Sumerlaeia bacterium]|nr:PQQ-binding-like beta-propeller repeat protein [Candidatus Sumerlaeia bacterium]